MSEGTLMIRFFSDYYLDKWCKYEIECNPDTIKKHLMLWIAKFAFFSWLPELPDPKFGRTMSSFPYEFVGERAKEGFSTFITSALGENWLEYFQNDYKDSRKRRSLVYQDVSDARDQHQITQPHPLALMELFVPKPLPLPPVNLTTMPRNSTLLTKLLLYSGYVEAISKQDNTSADDVVKQELKRFPYKVKGMFIVRGYLLSELLGNS